MAKKFFNENEAFRLSQKLGDKASEKDITRINKKLKYMNHGPVRKVWDKVLMLWEQLKNPETPWYRKSIIIGGLLYLIIPFDILSDAIPGLGFLDDVFVILCIAKQVLELTTLVVVNTVKEKVDKQVKVTITENLNKAMKNSLINMAISFSVTATGIVIAIFKPFGQTIAYYIASFIFIGWFIFVTLRNVKLVKTALPWVKSVIKEKGVKKGIISEAKKQYHSLEVLENVKRNGSVFIHALDEIPCLEELYDYYLGYFKKKLLILGAVAVSYVVVVQFVLKPVLLNQFGGISTFEIYVYPLTHVWKTVATFFNK